ncbi:MAG TPA: HD domain-containing protein [Coriobacteriia bacterium]
MKEQYVSDLSEGTAVDSLFAVRSRDLRAARTGDAYLAMELADRTGAMSAVMFRPGPEEWSVPPGSVARVRGTVTSYRGVRRVSVESLRPAPVYQRGDMIATGSRKREELVAAFETLRRGVSHEGLRAVLQDVFGDRGFVDRFCECPAAVRYHHAYVGGLLEHTVGVASLCRVLASRYDGADADLLVSAALLHDVGTVEELRFDTSVELTDAGRLLGHVVLGERVVSAAIARAGSRVDEHTALRLLHLVVAHHNDARSAAAVRPSCLEALLLHHADDLDAQASGFASAIAGAAVLEEPWTDAENGFGRPLYAGAGRTRETGERVCVPTG